MSTKYLMSLIVFALTLVASFFLHKALILLGVIPLGYMLYLFIFGDDSDDLLDDDDDDEDYEEYDEENDYLYHH